MLHTAVEAIDQHQGQFGLALGQRGADDKVALAGGGADVHRALVVEARAQHTHVDASAEGVIGVLQLLQHSACTALVEGIQIGDDGGDASVQVGTVLAQGLEVLLHIGIHLAAAQSQRGIGIHQQVEVIDEVLVALPQVARLTEEAHALLDLDGVDGTQRGCRHNYR